MRVPKLPHQNGVVLRRVHLRRNTTTPCSIENLEVAHLALYESIDSSAPADLQQLWLTPSVTVDDLVPGTFVNLVEVNITTRQIGVANLGLETVNHLRKVRVGRHG
jgi:hypothetical protein